MAGSVVQTLAISSGKGVATLTFAWTGDASDGTIPATAISAAHLAKLEGFKLDMLYTDPGAVAPTDNYDITLEDANGVDILGGAGADRDTANTERALPLVGAAVHQIPIDGGALTFKIANQAVHSATGVAKFFFVK
jgi:hypothetical protein